MSNYGFLYKVGYTLKIVYNKSCKTNLVNKFFCDHM